MNTPRLQSALMLLLFLSCCTNQETSPPEEKLIKFKYSDFPDFKVPGAGLRRLGSFIDTLMITVEFATCGEWGGNHEKILLYRTAGESISAHFTQDTVPCNKIISKNGVGVLDDNARVIVFDTTVLLSKEGEKMVNLFLHRILELSMNHDLSTVESEIIDGEETTYVFQESRIEIMSKNGDFNLSFYNIDQLAFTWYGYVRREIVGNTKMVNT